MSAASGSLRAEFTWISPNPNAWAAPGSESAIIKTNGFCPRDILCSKVLESPQRLRFRRYWCKCYATESAADTGDSHDSAAVHACYFSAAHAPGGVAPRRAQAACGPGLPRSAALAAAAAQLSLVPLTRCAWRTDRRRRYGDSRREAHPL